MSVAEGRAAAVPSFVSVPEAATATNRRARRRMVEEEENDDDFGALDTTVLGKTRALLVLLATVPWDPREFEDQQTNADERARAKEEDIVKRRAEDSLRAVSSSGGGSQSVFVQRCRRA